MVHLMTGYRKKALPAFQVEAAGNGFGFGRIND